MLRIVRNRIFQLMNAASKLIIVAVRRNPLTQNVVQQEVESIIKLWLTNGEIEMVEDCIGRTRIMLPN
ncbi:hypothetical protein RN001_008836 [Aquatica leii]|uniref:Uncharacterized protein n=1 Tax=Aquatica leii TaxID=1421715 RepID=A0AAN7P4S3_9COLE|nr:hypothetical protein RN001_008836 [Aquatica leii]